ncbi:sugar phosphate isomerase/epimerase family protein [Candidatus Laterigemmans baculatus]|uniref:sugar phosphate isomerase/epimerase family protein n=1 Tax=Candidatus Laterigemmans baculatus TaxID=2770505 RepID=UPI0013DBD750|nr:sugar phosphate isomerase/epimerase family protein [Candidatus Laterigemmans baculatus]
MKSCITVSLVEEARGGPFVLWDSLRAACELAERLGFDAIEIFAAGPDAVDPRELHSLLDDHSLRLAAVGTGAGWVKHRLQLADPDPAQRRRAVDFVRSMIDFGGPFGAAAIIGSMQGRHGDEVSPEQARGYLAEALEACGEHAAPFQTPLFYEPLNRYETNQITTVDAGVGLLEHLSTKNVKLLCDLFHMQIEECDVAAALRRGGRHVGHVHFVDSNRRPVGGGHTDFRPIVQALRDIDYSGYLSAEAFPHPNPQAAAEQTIRAFRYWTGCP